MFSAESQAWVGRGVKRTLEKSDTMAPALRSEPAAPGRSGNEVHAAGPWVSGRSGT